MPRGARRYYSKWTCITDTDSQLVRHPALLKNMDTRVNICAELAAICNEPEVRFQPTGPKIVFPDRARASLSEAYRVCPSVGQPLAS
jgi:hypothetical protein